jgi:hypothetical protein
MPSNNLIIVITTLFIIAFIYSSSSSFNVYAVPPDKRWGNNCSTDFKTGEKTCCWRERVPGQLLGKTYCQTCDIEGKNCKEKVLQFVSPSKLGDSVLPGDGGVLEQPPTAPGGNDANVPLEGGILEQQEQPPNQGGLLGLLDETNPTIQLDDDSTLPQPKGNKGLLGLLDENNPTFQQQQPSLPETTIPQRTVPNTDDLLSNLDDNLFTNIPNEENSEPLNLLEENKQQGFPITETDSDKANTVKDDDKEETEQEEEQEQQPLSPEQSEEQQEGQISINQKNDEKQSGEDDDDEREEQEQQEQEEQPPLIAESLNPNMQLVE